MLQLGETISPVTVTGIRRDSGATIARAQPILIRRAGGRGILEGEDMKIG